MYNQIVVAFEDQHKMGLGTKFGTLVYWQMLFGVTSASSTYQRGVDHIFATNIIKGVELYVKEYVVQKRVRKHRVHSSEE